MFLLITLCIIVWCVIHKRRKLLYSTGNVHIMSPVSFHNSSTIAHAYEITNMKTNVTVTDLGMDASTCK